jgi:hypothetical protein
MDLQGEKQGILEMSQEELLQLIVAVRARRRVRVKPDAPKKRTPKKVQTMLAGLTEEQLTMLLNMAKEQK